MSFKKFLRCIENVPCFYGPNDKWLAAQELVLLTSMQFYSYENWELHADILSRTFNKKFTPEEVFEHYNKTYMEGDFAKALNFVPFKCFLEDHTTEDDDELLKIADKNAYKHVPPEFLKQLGYMPLRFEFSEEYEPSAEDLLFCVTFRIYIDNTLTKTKDVDSYDKNINFLVIDAYREIIKERVRLKKIVKEFRLVEQYYKRSKDQISENYTSSLNLEKDMKTFSVKKPKSNIKQLSKQKHMDESKYLHLRKFSEAERKLCSKLHLNPSFYMEYKNAIQKNGDNEELKVPEKMTVAQCLQIANFLKKSGWIKIKNFYNLLEE